MKPNEIETHCAECKKTLPQARLFVDPPNAVRVVYHTCTDGASFHYEDADGNKIEPETG